jgi:hypothetical protein
VYTEDGFELEDAAAGAPSDRAMARRATVKAYAHPLEDYATKFDFSLRTIKRWIALGRSRDPLDLPPLDDSVEMAAWWERMRAAGVLKWKVPEVFGVSGLKDAKKGAVNSEQESASSRRAGEAASEQALGFAAALRRAQEAERLAHARWQEELKRDAADFDPVSEKRRAEAWDRAAKLLESLETKADKILGRDFCRMEDVEELVVERETALRDGLRSMGTRVCTKLGLPAEMYTLVVEGINVELDRVFGHLAAGEGPLFELES